MNLENKNKNSKIFKNEIINLKPTYVIPEEQTYNIINFNSFFLYLFFILELVIVIFILYFFFKKEIIFVFKNIFSGTDYTNEEKIIYNNNLYKIKNLFESTKYCKFFDKIEIDEEGKVLEKKYLPLYNNNKFMKALNDDIIYFEQEKECNEFLDIS